MGFHTHGDSTFGSSNDSLGSGSAGGELSWDVLAFCAWFIRCFCISCNDVYYIMILQIISYYYITISKIISYNYITYNNYTYYKCMSWFPRCQTSSSTGATGSSGISWDAKQRCPHIEKGSLNWLFHPFPPFLSFTMYSYAHILCIWRIIR